MSQIIGFGNGGSGGSGIQVLAGNTGSATGTTVNVIGGSGITTSGSGDTLTISATGITTLNYTYVDFSMSPYTVLSTDDFLGCDSSTGQITILLPDAPVTGRTFVIKDIAGSAPTNSVAITTVSGTDLIDGITITDMNSAYQSVQVLYNGANNYYIF